MKVKKELKRLTGHLHHFTHLTHPRLFLLLLALLEAFFLALDLQYVLSAWIQECVGGIK
jgi:hypothetical protein